MPGLAWLGEAGVAKGGIVEQKAIGYRVNASALQVARAYAALATGALPQLSLVDDGPREAIPLGVHELDLDRVRDGMRACVTTPSGTAREVAGLQAWGVLAKTGTAEITTKKDNNAWLAGYLTRRQPTLAFAAVAYHVPDGKHGGDVAGALVASFLGAVHADPDLRQRYMPEASGR